MKQLLEAPKPSRAVTPVAQGHRGRTLVAGLGLTLALLLSAVIGATMAEAAVRGPDVVAQDEGGDSGSGGDEGGTTGGDEGGTTGGDAGSGGETGGDDSDGTSLSTEEWILLGILGVLGIVVIMGVTSLASHHSDKKNAAKANLNSRLGEIVGAARWVHDQGSMDVLRVTDPRQLASTWDGVRERIIDLEAKVSGLGSQVSDRSLQQALARLGQTAAGLRGALESSVSLRLGADAAGQADLIRSARQAVDERRQQFGQAIDPVAAAQR